MPTPKVAQLTPVSSERLLGPSPLHVAICLVLGIFFSAAPFTQPQAAAMQISPATSMSLDANNVFREAPLYSTLGSRAEQVVVADVNGDGRPDLVVADSCIAADSCFYPSHSGVTILLGNGDGTLQTPVVYDTGGMSASAVAVSDVNGDGKLDLVVSNGGSNSVGVLLGNGDGTFRAAVTYSAGSNFQGPVGVAVADVNGDGAPDIVLSICLMGDSIHGCDNQGITVLRGNGNGTFRAPLTSASAGGAYADSLAVADVNGDGKLDVLVGDYSGVEVLLGNGNGTFQAPLRITSLTNVGPLAIADVNGDGRRDLITTDSLGNLVVLLGNGNGTFQAPVTYTTSGGVSSVAVADVNGDGKPDLLATANETAIVLLGNGNGTFQAAVSYGSVGFFSSSIAVGDTDLDGKLDLVVANYCIYQCGTASYEGGVAILRGNGDGTFQGAPKINPGANPIVGAADVNGDGIADLIVNNPGGQNFGTVGVMLGTGHATFQPAVTFGQAGLGTGPVVAADVNGDGKPDLLVPNRCTTNCAAINAVEGTVAVLLGNGDGTFSTAVNYRVGGGYPQGLAAGDVNGDGKADLVIADCVLGPFSCGSSAVSVLLGNGDGTFQAPIIYSANGDSSIGLALQDLNGDGKLDVVISNQGSIGVLLGNGNGTFQPAVNYATISGEAGMLTLVDVNGDGKADALTDLSGGLVVLLGNGDGTFQPEKTYPTPISGGTGSIQVADFNGDGRLDVAASDFLWLGNGDGTFQNPVLLGARGASQAMGDFNGDGTPDLVNAAGIILLNLLPDEHALTTNTLTASPNPSAIGQPVTFTALASSSGSVPPTGVVTFAINGNKPVIEPLVNGRATFPWTFQRAGSRTVTARYPGDANNAASLSDVVTQVVNAQYTSQTNLTASTNPSSPNQQVTYTANIVSSGGPAPTGTVIFTISGNRPVTVPVSNGQAVFNWTFLYAGSRTVTATYSGDTANSTSTSSLNQVVNPGPATTTALSSSLNPSQVNQTVTFTARVTGQSGNPTGTVTFTINGNKPVTQPLSSGQATFNWTFLYPGARTVTATYSGDPQNASSTSPVLPQTIN